MQVIVTHQPQNIMLQNILFWNDFMSFAHIDIVQSNETAWIS